MIFSINHIDLKNRSNSKTKVFSKAEKIEYEMDAAGDVLTAISAPARVLSKSGLNDKKFLFDYTGDTVQFNLSFEFSSMEKLICKGSFSSDSSLFIFECDILHKDEEAGDQNRWLKTKIRLRSQAVVIKPYSSIKIDGEVYIQFKNLFSEIRNEVKDGDGVSILNPSEFRTLLEKKDLISKMFIPYVENILAVAQLKHLAEDDPSGLLQRLESNKFHSIVCDEMLDYLQDFYWKTEDATDIDSDQESV